MTTAAQAIKTTASTDGSSKRIVIDGGFAANLPFARCLAALRPSQGVSVSQSRDETALGAALLWRRFARTLPVSSVVLEAVTPLGEAGLDRPGLSAAYQSCASWRIVTTKLKAKDGIEWAAAGRTKGK